MFFFPMEPLDDIFKILRKEAIGSEAYFPEKGYKAITVSKEFFRPIPSIKSRANLFFIDGGQAELFSAPDFSIGIIRLACVVFQLNQRKEILKEEFVALTRTEFIEDKLSYVVTTYPNRFFPSPIIFEAFDKTLTEGMHRAKFPKILEEIRKCAEINFAKQLAEEKAVSGDIFILDGDLEAATANSKKAHDDLYNSALSKDVLVCALAKTSSLLTDKGSSFIALLTNIAPLNIWHYYPIVEINDPNHQAELFFLKLSNSSTHIFKLEIYKKHPPVDREKVFSLLAQNSRDLTFPGYPYGLIFADKLARVSMQETKQIRLKMAVQFSKEIKGVTASLNASDAHEVLDKIAYKNF